MIHRENVIDMIPANKRQKYVANAAQMVAQATYQVGTLLHDLFDTRTKIRSQSCSNGCTSR